MTVQHTTEGNLDLIAIRVNKWSACNDWGSSAKWRLVAMEMIDNYYNM